MKVGILSAIFLLFSSVTWGQRVVPSKLDYTAVVGFTSPAQHVAFSNTGTEQLPLTVSVSGPFVISDNKCFKGPLPGTHCDIYVTYTPQTVGEEVEGAINFDYGSGASVVALSGSGVQYLPTETYFIQQKQQYRLGKTVTMQVYFGAGNKKEGYGIPWQELINFSCSLNQETVAESAPITGYCKREPCPPAQHGIALTSFTPDQVGIWQCSATYPGDGFNGPSSGNWQVNIIP